jgi:hypothetical protein
MSAMNIMCFDVKGMYWLELYIVKMGFSAEWQRKWRMAEPGCSAAAAVTSQ